VGDKTQWMTYCSVLSDMYARKDCRRFEGYSRTVLCPLDPQSGGEELDPVCRTLIGRSLVSNEYHHLLFRFESTAYTATILLIITIQKSLLSRKPNYLPYRASSLNCIG